jgi:hypothetical protein
MLVVGHAEGYRALAGEHCLSRAAVAFFATFRFVTARPSVPSANYCFSRTGLPSM